MPDKKLLSERSVLLEKLIEKTWADEQFKARLLKEPVKAVEQALDVTIPGSINVQVLEETATTRYIVLPYMGSDNDELHDEELDAVAGGTDGGGPVPPCNGQQPTEYGKPPDGT